MPAFRAAPDADQEKQRHQRQLEEDVKQYVNQYAYLPFGQTITLSSTFSNPFTFVGSSGVTTDAAGTVSMGFRVYDPTTGQFLSNDPFGVFGGDANIRRYVGNNPTTNIDPWGTNGGQSTFGSHMGMMNNQNYQHGPANPINAIQGNLNSAPLPAGYHYGPITPRYEPIKDCKGNVIGQKLVGYFVQILNSRNQVVRTVNYSAQGGFIGGDDPQSGPGGPGSGATCPCQCGPGGPGGPGCPGGPGGTGGGPPINPPHDPNNIIGPAGFGDENFVPSDEVLPYTINFENDPDAGLPAQQVTVTEQLDPNLNWQSFRLGSFGFGGQTYQVPANTSFYQTLIDLTATLGFEVQVTGTIDVRTGLMTWTFTTIDPSTGTIPLDPSIGFLPPDVSGGEGEGFVSYAVQANSNAPTGTVINAQATVTFYTQPPINTAQIFNTLDDSASLASAVAALPGSEASPNFSVAWSGTDSAVGAAIAGYTIYVSDDGAPYVPWLVDTSLTAGTYSGRWGHSYAFISQAIDNAGNVEAPHTTADAQTTVATNVSSTPGAPALAPGSDTGISTTDGLTDLAQPTFTGTGIPGETIEIFANGNLIASGPIADGGSYSVTATTALSNGVYTITADQVDSQGQHSGLSANMVPNLDVDTTAPTVKIDPAAMANVLDPLTITFSKPVYGLTLASLQFSENGGANLLTSAQFLSTSDNITWTLGGVGALVASVGSYTLSLSSAGITDAAGNPLVAGASNTYAVTAISQVGTKTSIESSDQSADYGESVTFTATVSADNAAHGTPTGSLTFMDGNNVLGSRTLDSNGQATFTTSGLAVADHEITAVYAANSSFGGSTSDMLDESITQDDTNITVTASANPVGAGQSLTLTATVSVVSPGAGTPTGIVTFYDGTSELGTGTLQLVGNNVVAMYTTSTLSQGTHSITATYGGDGNDLGVSSTALSEVVKTASTVALSDSAASTVYGQSLQLMAKVSTSSGVATGTVTFYDGSTSIGTATIHLGQATLTTTSLAVGGHMLTAVYAGNNNFAPDTSNVVGETVGQDASSVSLSSSAASAVYGQSVTFTAVVGAAKPGSGNPTGTVTFMDGSNLLGAGTLSVVRGNVQATFTTGGLAIGSHSITAVYGGDDNFTGNTSAATNEAIRQASTSVSLSSSAKPGMVGQTITFTATVSVTGKGSGNPTGAVTFKDGNTVIGTGTLQEQGGSDVATFSTSSLAIGLHRIVAVYGGDSNYDGSTSSMLIKRVVTASTVINPDVNGDGYVTPQDALIIINQLNDPVTLTDAALEQLDINYDGSVNALDALIIINYLNGVPVPSLFGSATAATGTAESAVQTAAASPAASTIASPVDAASSGPLSSNPVSSDALAAASLSSGTVASSAPTAAVQSSVAPAIVAAATGSSGSNPTLPSPAAPSDGSSGAASAGAATATLRKPTAESVDGVFADLSDALD